jgi:hypothetical protein
MKSFPFSDLLRSVNSLGNLAHSISDSSDLYLPAHNRQDIFKHCETIKKICEEYCLDNCSITASKLLKVINEGVQDTELPLIGPCYRWSRLATAQFKNLSNELGGRVSDSLSVRVFIEIKENDKILFNKSEDIFGEFMNIKFPSSVSDVSEASACLALGRYTASIFHLMRAMEASIPILSRFIGSNYLSERNEILSWGILISNIKVNIDKLPKSALQDDLYKIHALLHSFNRAFRVKAAHPGELYDEDEARTVFSTVRNYFQELSDLV